MAGLLANSYKVELIWAFCNKNVAWCEVATHLLLYM